MRWLVSWCVLFAAGCALPWIVPRAPGAFPERAVANDGYVLALSRRVPVGQPTGRPVLLVHGIGANDRNMDLHEGTSLAAWLTSHGRETWSLSPGGTATRSLARVR